MKTENYTLEELISIASIYNEVRNSIHERNPIIRRKGNELNRPTRGIEAQLLMFRSYEKKLNGENYGYDRWSKLIPEVYEEFIIGQNLLVPTADISVDLNNSEDMVENQNGTFPENFLKFKKSNKSSVSLVRDCFENKRVIGRISTHLHEQLYHFLNLENAPSKIIGLIGGAGNGKTDSIGFVIDQIKQLGKIDNEDSFNDLFLKSLEKNNYFGKYSNNQLAVYVIADATSRLEGKQRYESFIYVLNEFIQERANEKYLIVCINRGILSDFVSKSFDSDYSELIGLLETTTTNEAYLNNVSNICEISKAGTQLNLLSYPIDKIRLFDEDNRVHEKMIELLKDHDWSDLKLYNHFCNLSTPISSLLNCHELYNSRYITFRDYLDLLYKLGYPLNACNSWANHPIIRLWFGLISDKYYEDLSAVLGAHNELLNDLKILSEYRIRNNLDVFIEYFPDHNNLINSDILDDILNLKVENLYDGYEIELYDSNGLANTLIFSNYYFDLLIELLNNYNQVYSGSFGNNDNKYNSKRAITNLVGELLAIMLFEYNGIYKHKDHLMAFDNLDFNLFKNNFLKLLKLEENAVARMRYTIDQNLTTELWSFRSHFSDIVVKSNLHLGIDLKEKICYYRPLIPNIFVEFVDLATGNKFNVEIDFKHFCQIQKYCVSNTGNLYYECVDSGFAIWLNTIKERLFSVGNSSSRLNVGGKNFEVEHGYNMII